MDPAKAPPKAQKHKRRNCALLSFFGDNSYGWFDFDCIEPYAENSATRSQQHPKSAKGKVKCLLVSAYGKVSSFKHNRAK